MSFTSLTFLVFLPSVTIAFFATPHRWRWLLLLVASYIFYMSWNSTYVLIILFTTTVSYCSALWIDTTEKRATRKIGLIISLITNIGFLVAFKYWDFLLSPVSSFLQRRSSTEIVIPSLNLLLPIGISFYTFQALSYSIDVYWKKRPAEKHFGIFALYISFFPQLVAGTIERSTRLLPQFYKEQTFSSERATNGLKLIALGFFKKLVVADQIGILVDHIYSNSHSSGLALTFATYLFAFQIYNDFSAYSDIAIGGARIMGFSLMKNFERPYAALTVGDFWRRWHISLCSWFRDYIYIPLGGNRSGMRQQVQNILIVFLISGLWHGAAWTFIIWGLLHGLFIALEIICSRLFQRVILPIHPLLLHGMHWLITFHMVIFAWIFFRAKSLAHAVVIIQSITEEILALFSGTLSWQTALNELSAQILFDRYELMLLAIAILSIEIIEKFRESKKLSTLFARQPIWLRWPCYYLLLISIIALGNFKQHAFIYFQF